MSETYLALQKELAQLLSKPVLTDQDRRRLVVLRNRLTAF